MGRWQRARADDQQRDEAWRGRMVGLRRPGTCLAAAIASSRALSSSGLNGAVRNSAAMFASVYDFVNPYATKAVNSLSFAATSYVFIIYTGGMVIAAR